MAGVVAALLREGEIAVLECIGPSSVYQAVRALQAAATFVKSDNIRVFTEIRGSHRTVDGKRPLAIILTVRGVHYVPKK